MNVDVTFTPAEFALLPSRDLSGTLCVVFDVLRATSSMITALAHGAEAIVPVAEISEALVLRKFDPQILLAGERHGVRIEAAMTGSIAFDLGNSPREFTSQKVSGKRIAMTTTNGTRALRACAGARTVLVSSFLNLQSTADWLLRTKPEMILLLCSGTFEETAYEDALGIGALCDLISGPENSVILSDAAEICCRVYNSERNDLVAGLARGLNGRRLTNHPELQGDVPFCARVDRFNIVAKMGVDGLVKIVPD